MKINVVVEGKICDCAEQAYKVTIVTGVYDYPPYEGTRFDVTCGKCKIRIIVPLSNIKTVFTNKD